MERQNKGLPKMVNPPPPPPPPPPTTEQIRWAISILNMAGGFQIIRKIEKDSDIIL